VLKVAQDDPSVGRGHRRSGLQGGATLIFHSS